MNKLIKLALITPFSFYSTLNAQNQPVDSLAQNTVVKTPIETKAPSTPMRIKFNEKGDKYVQLGIWNQVWFRSIENNPGTVVNTIPQDHTTDAGIRRFRLTAQFEINPRYRIFMQVGMNNQSFTTGGGTGSGVNGAGKKPSFFVHDAYNEYDIIQKNKEQKTSFSLSLGAGLHAWNGISRLSNTSTTKMLTADIPILNFPTIEMSDQFARQFGIFVHGEVGKLAYRMNVNKPFATNQNPQINRAFDNNKYGNLSFAGYFAYQFLDKDAQNTSFLAQNYLGEKNMFNIGAGFYKAPKSTISLDPITNQENIHNSTTLGVDVYLDKKIGDPSKKMTFNLYSVLYIYNFGKNYYRTTGIMNPGEADPNFTGQTALEGFGYNRINFGTGNVWYTQTGILLPEFSKEFRLQPYAVYTLKDLKTVNQIGHYYDLGLNILFHNHNAKLSLNYGSRPLYDKINKEVFTRKGEYLACFQINF